jgi:hypothetical protein
MTASGSDYDEVDPLLTAAFVDPDEPLPENPAAVAELDAIFSALAAAPEPWPTSPPPQVAEVISGKTYVTPEILPSASRRLDAGIAAPPAAERCTLALLTGCVSCRPTAPDCCDPRLWSSGLLLQRPILARPTLRAQSPLS